MQKDHSRRYLWFMAAWSMSFAATIWVDLLFDDSSLSIVLALILMLLSIMLLIEIGRRPGRRLSDRRRSGPLWQRFVRMGLHGLIWGIGAILIVVGAIAQIITGLKAG